jgi:tetratricopeptide (TPR) repeat protein
MGQLKRLIREIHRRSLWQVIGIYLFGSWAAVEVVQTLSESLGLPEWFPALAVVLLIIGFPVVVATAFVQEGGPGERPAVGRDAGSPATFGPGDGPSTSSLAVEPAPPASAGRMLTWRNAIAGGVAATVFWAVVAGAWLTFFADSEGPAPEGAAAGDTAVVAVFPFRVPTVATELQHLGEGMVDLLAAKLGGEGGIAVVDPRAAVSAWRGVATDSGVEATRATLLEAAARLGAGRLIDGGVVQAGPTIAISADLLEVASGERLVSASVEGPQDSVLALVEELAARLMVGESLEGRRLEALLSTSLPALREYLEGQQAYRRGEYARAALHFERAVEFDSTFALAGLGLREAGGWSTAVASRQQAMGLRVAHRNLNRLTPADRALLDVLGGPNYPAPSSARERLGAARRAVELAANMPEAWYELGDELYHHGSTLREDRFLDQAERAFARSLGLDPTFTAALEHLIDTNVRLADTADVRRHGEHYLATRSGAVTDFFRWRMVAALGDSAALGALVTELENFSDQSLWRVVGYGAVDGRPMPEVREAVRVLEGRAARADSDPVARDVLRQWYLNAGRPTVAARLAGPSSDAGAALRRIHEALWWDGEEQAALAAVDRLERIRVSAAEAPDDRLTAHCGVAEWRLLKDGDDQTVRDVAEILRRSPDATPSGQALAHVCLTRLEALAAGPGADVAVARLDSLATQGAVGDYILIALTALTAARVHSNRGDAEQALVMARSGSYTWRFANYVAPTLLLRARLAARLDLRDEAISAYRHYLDLRHDPEPAVAPRVEQARTELSRLLADS